MDDLLSIGEFSERCGLSPKMLRSYADAGLLVPMAVDRMSGYRYYAPGQLHEAAVVAGLRRAGIPVADIRSFIAGPTAYVLDEWERRLQDEMVVRREALGAVRELMLLAAPPGAVTSHPTARSGGATVAQLRTSSSTHIGRVRLANEDAIAADEHIVVIADGMGGAPGGALAARTATDVLRRVFRGGSLSDLRDAVLAANAEIWELSHTDEELNGMGTTICAVGAIDEGGRARLGVASVGDTRAYLARDGRLQQITEDHTVVSDLIRRGELDPGQAAKHPHRHVLTRVLGMAPKVDVDTVVVSLEPGDRLLLCTDGLHNEVSDTDIAALLRDGDVGDGPAHTAENLVAAALAAGGADNISVALIDVAAVETSSV